MAESGAFKHCPGKSPACLGMVQFDCCRTQRLLKKLVKELNSSMLLMKRSSERLAY